MRGNVEALNLAVAAPAPTPAQWPPSSTGAAPGSAGSHTSTFGSSKPLQEATRPSGRR